MKRTMLLLSILASCAGARMDRQQALWCLPDSMPGTSEDPHLAWAPLPENAARIVRPENIRSLLPLLQRNALIEVTRARAEEVAGPLPPFSGGHYYLTRGGVVGGWAVTLEEYLRNAGDSIYARASIDREDRALLVDTFQMSTRDYYQNVAMIVWTPTRVTRLVVHCHAGA